MQEEIKRISEEEFLGTTVDAWVQFFCEKYAVEIPSLREDGIEVSREDTSIDVSRKPGYFAYGSPTPVYVPGTAISHHVPFDGDGQAFSWRPSTYTTMFPRAHVGDDELVFTFLEPNPDAAALRQRFDGELSQVRQYLVWLRNQAGAFTAGLAGKVRSWVESRRSKLERDRTVTGDLGFPVRRREDAPSTFRVPAVRRKVVLPRPQVTAAKPEPMLQMEEYEHTLEVVRNMVMVMERSPHAFRSMPEEALRDHFLVQLNGQYEGQATGETFNFEGKTDILIRVGGRNIFIAECKFWEGPERLLSALDQLLGYATWRDSKLALLVFNRDRQLSTVLGKIAEVISGHSSFVRGLDYGVEGGFRFVVRHRDDPARELLLTVLVFEVPR